jgi:hypothetical protein
MTDDLYKPGYDGERPSPKLSGPERQLFLQKRREMQERIHKAMLVISVSEGTDDLGVRSGAPPALREFSDLVGREKEQEPKQRFRPTPQQISAAGPALELLEGLTKTHFKVVFLRALDTFNSEWPWDRIGGAFAMSDRWAESAYDAAMVQAARRAGILPMSTKDHAILCCAVWHDAMDRNARGWLSCITTSADPRQEASNLRSKSPLRIENAAAIWTNGKPLAQRVVAEAKKQMLNRASHGAWFRINPDEVVDRLIGAARLIEAPWHLEELFASRVAA